ncbi:MAG: hypothetical protein ACM3UO_00090 [Bacillota bacterium]
MAPLTKDEKRSITIPPMVVGDPGCFDMAPLHAQIEQIIAAREARTMRRVERLKQTLQWGHNGRHHGNGSPDCPRELHHHCDDYCALPTPTECRLAGVQMPEGGWHRR